MWLLVMLKIDSSKIKKISDFYSQLDYISFWACNYLLCIFQLNTDFICSEKTYSADEILHNYNVEEQHKQLLITLLDLMHESGLLEKHQNRQYSLGSREVVELGKLVDQKDTYLKSHSDLIIHFDFIHGLLDKYFLILSGKETFLSCLFENGAFDVPHALYEHSKEAKYFNSQVAQAIIYIVNKKSRNQMPLRILEIGAGVGATTFEVLEASRGNASLFEYYYTDVSSAFLAYGSRRFSAENNLRFSRYDINIDFRSQGQSENYYDVIIAANSLHNAIDLNWSIAQVKHILKPNGCLVLSEAVEKNNYATFTFGLSSQWWSAEDRHLRIPNSPLVSTKVWKKIFKKSGFQSCEAISDVIAQSELVNISHDLILAFCCNEGHFDRPWSYAHAE